MPTMDYQGQSQDNTQLPLHESIGATSFSAQAASLNVELQSALDGQFRALNVGQRVSDTFSAATGSVQSAGQLIRNVQPLANAWLSNLGETLRTEVLANAQLALDANTRQVAAALQRPVSVSQLFSVFGSLENGLFENIRDVEARANVLVSGARVAERMVTGLRDQVTGLGSLVTASQDFLSRGEGAISNLGAGVLATGQQLLGLSTYTAQLDTQLNRVLGSANAMLALNPLEQVDQLRQLNTQLSQGFTGLTTQLSQQATALANPELISAMVLDRLGTINTAALSGFDTQLTNQIATFNNLRAAGTATQAEISAAARQVQQTFQARFAAAQSFGATVTQISQFSSLLGNIGTLTNNANIAKAASIVGGAAQVAMGVYAFFNPAMMLGMGGPVGALSAISGGLGGVFSGFGRGGGSSSNNGMQSLLNAILPVLNQISQQIENLQTYVELRANHTDQLILNLGDRVDDLGDQLQHLGVVLRTDISELRRQMDQNQRQLLDNFIDVRNDLAGIRRLVEAVAEDADTILDMLDAIARQIHLIGYNQIVTQTIGYYDAQAYNPSHPALSPTATYQNFLSMVQYATQGATASDVHGDTAGRYDLTTIGRIPTNGTLEYVNLLLGFARNNGAPITSGILPHNLSVPFDRPYSPTLSNRVINPLVWARVVDDIMKFIEKVPELHLRSGDRNLIQNVIAYGEQFLQEILSLKTSSRLFENLLNAYGTTFNRFTDQLQLVVVEALGIRDTDIQQDMQAFQASVNQESAQILVNNMNNTLVRLDSILSPLPDLFHDCNVMDYRMPFGIPYHFPYDRDTRFRLNGDAICYLTSFELVQRQSARQAYQGRPVESCYAPSSWALINHTFNQLLNYETNCQHPENREFIGSVLASYRARLPDFYDFQTQIQVAFLSFNDFLNASIPYNASALQAPWRYLAVNAPNTSLFNMLNQSAARLNQITACRPEQFDYACQWPSITIEQGVRMIYSRHGEAVLNDRLRYYRNPPFLVSGLAPDIVRDMFNNDCQISCPAHFIQDNSLFNPYTVIQNRSNRGPDDRVYPDFSDDFSQLRTNLNHEMTTNINPNAASYMQYAQGISNTASSLANKLVLKDTLNNPSITSPIVRFLNIANWVAQNATQAQRNSIQTALLSQLVGGTLLQQALDQLSQYKHAIKSLLRLTYGGEYVKDIALQQGLSSLWSGDEIETAIQGYNASDTNTSVFVRLYNDMLKNPVMLNGSVNDLPWTNVTRYLQAAIQSAQALQNAGALSPDYTFIVERLQLLYFIRDVMLPKGISPLDILPSIIADAYEGSNVAGVGSAADILTAISQQGLNIDSVDSAGSSAFMLLVQRCNASAINLLSNRTGINRNRLNSNHESALNLALSCQHRATRYAMLNHLLAQNVSACLATDALESELLAANVPAPYLANVACLSFTSTTTPTVAGSTSHNQIVTDASSSSTLSATSATSGQVHVSSGVENTVTASTSHNQIVTDASTSSTLSATSATSEQENVFSGVGNSDSHPQDQAAQNNNQALSDTSVAIISSAAVLIAAMVVFYLKGREHNDLRRIAPLTYQDTQGLECRDGAVHGRMAFSAINPIEPVRDDDLVITRRDASFNREVEAQIPNDGNNHDLIRPTLPPVRNGMRRPGFLEVSAVIICMLSLANLAETADPTPMQSTVDQDDTAEQTGSSGDFTPPNPESSPRVDSPLKTLYMRNLPAHAHVAEYLKAQHGVDDVLADMAMQPFSDFTGNLMLLQVMIHLFKTTFFPEESNDVPQRILTQKDKNHIKQINTLEQSIRHNQLVCNRVKAKYPEHDFAWVQFCLSEYQDRLEVLTSSSLINIEDLSGLKKDMKQFKTDMRFEIDRIRQDGSESLGACSNAKYGMFDQSAVNDNRYFHAASFFAMNQTHRNDQVASVPQVYMFGQR